MEGFRHLLRDEPLIFKLLIHQLILAVVAFGLDFNETQIVLTMAAVETLLQILSRSLVTPTANVAATVQAAVVNDRLKRPELTDEQIAGVLDHLEREVNRREVER